MAWDSRLEWEPKPDSAAARLDEEDYLRRCAADRARCEAPVPLIPATAVTRRQMDAVLEFIGQFVAKTVAPLNERIKRLEQQTALKYAGVWKQGGDYLPGEFVTYQGGLWYCKQHTGTRPNACHEAWRLAVKSARPK